MHFNNPVNIPVKKICQGNIVSEKERHSGIVVLKIQAFTKSFRELVYKAENAVVGTSSLLIHKIGFKFKSRFAVLQPERNSPPFSVRLFNYKLSFFVKVELIIQNITDFMTVNAYQLVSGLNKMMRRRRTALNR